MLGKRLAAPLGLLLVSTALALLAAEVIVRLVVHPGDFLPATLIEDPTLGRRIKPHTTGHDALGFRNAQAMARASVVAIGDSMTYGYGAVGSASWPRQLEALLRQPVYNMGLGGYGPLHYLHLAEHDARKLRPQTLLIGFYFGNDLIDAYAAANLNAHWHGWRDANAVSIGESKLWQVDAAEPRKAFSALRNWLSKHSVLYSMARVTLLPRLALWEQDRIATQAPDRWMIWVDRSRPAVRTIFTPGLRLPALDPELPMVQEGLRITKRAFAALKAAADAQGMRLLVVLIPTKERAYCPYLRDSGDRMPGTLIKLCDAEERVKADLIQHLAAQKVRYVDATRAMEADIRKHVQLYPKNSDAHPQAEGYGAIARAVHEAMRQP